VQAGGPAAGDWPGCRACHSPASMQIPRRPDQL